MMENYLSECIDIIDEILMNSVNFGDSIELMNTFIFAKKNLMSYKIETNTHQDFDFLLKEIKKTLSNFLIVLKNRELYFSVISELPENLRLQFYEMDYIINLQLNQLFFIFPPEEKSDNLIELSNKSANIFWTENFGKNTRIVPCELFLNKISIEPIKRKIISHFLDFTRDGYVSIYEFEILTSIFGFTDLTLEYFSNLIDIYDKNLFYGFIPSYKAEILIKGNLFGTFIIRISKSDPHNLAITFNTKNNEIKHLLLFSKFGEFTLKNPPMIYKKIEDFIHFYKGILIYPMGINVDCTQLESISKSIDQQNNIFDFHERNKSNEHFNQINPNSEHVSKLSNENVILLNKNIDSSGEISINTCIICYSDKRNVLFMNCKHLICCDTCSEKIKNCPICRKTIVEKIKVFVC